MFCYLDFRSHLKANYPKSLPFALNSIFAFKIHTKIGLGPVSALGEKGEKNWRARKQKKRLAKGTEWKSEEGKGGGAAYFPFVNGLCHF